MAYEFIRERMHRARTPFGEVPLSSAFGYDYPLLPIGTDWDLNEPSLRSSSLSQQVANFIRTSRSMSTTRLDDPLFDLNPDLDPIVWPRATSVLRAPSRARSLSPIRDSTFRLSEPLRARTPLFDVNAYRTPTASSARTTSVPRGASIPPMRTTSISYSNTTPWNTTGFYYSPRYPESYRGSCSSSHPYAFSRRYYDYDVYNPYRIPYFKFPKEYLQVAYGRKTPFSKLARRNL